MLLIKWMENCEAMHLPGHSQPPPLALLATAAAYDRASKIKSFWGCMAKLSAPEALEIEESGEENMQLMTN